MNNGISESLITAQFFNSMYACGITPRENFTPNMDGNTHRFAVDGDKGSAKSGAYFIHANDSDDDAITFGVMDYHKHDSMQHFTFDYSVLDADTRREYLKQQNTSSTHGISGIRTISQTQQAEIERKQKEKANANKEIQQAALRMALREYQHAHLTYVHLHPYLKSRFVDLGIFIPNTDIHIKRVVDPYRSGICRAGELIVPMFNVITGNFQSLIHIPVKPDKERGFLKLIYKDTSIIGAAFSLVPKHSSEADTVLVAEGVTTALACVVLTGGKSPVFSVGTCGNLFSVCEGLRMRFPNKRICIMADDDKATEIKTGHNPGIEAAEKCVSAGVAHYFKAPPGNHSVNYDWYDFLKEVIQNKERRQ